jgi:hypothetical protein
LLLDSTAIIPWLTAGIIISGLMISVMYLSRPGAATGSCHNHCIAITFFHFPDTCIDVSADIKSEVFVVTQQAGFPAQTGCGNYIVFS